MCSSPSSFFFSLIIILRLGILLLFVLLEKKASFFFIPFWPLLDQFRVLVFFLGNRPAPREEDKKKDWALLLSLVFDENNMMEVFFVSSRDLRLFACCGLKRSLFFVKCYKHSME